MRAWRAEAPTPVRSELAGSHRRKGKGGNPVRELKQGAGFCLLWAREDAEDRFEEGRMKGP